MRKILNRAFLHGVLNRAQGCHFKNECKKVLFNNFTLAHFSWFDQLFFPTKSTIYVSKFIMLCFMNYFVKFRPATFFAEKKPLFTLKESLLTLFFMGKKLVGLRKSLISTNLRPFFLCFININFLEQARVRAFFT